jgi:iron complex outermembrane receptor protein
MKRNRLKIAMAGLLLFLLATNNATAADQVSSEEALLFLELPIVITASKNEETATKAPSVVYVFSANDIKRSGARTLADVLKRLPGFRLGYRETTIVGSRGFTSDQIDKFVWLIDGAPITNIVQDGPWGFLDIPFMDMVDRVEVVKGPGSTLWGSNASLGIINVITKTGDKINGTIPSYSFSSRDEQHVGSIVYGKETDKANYMFSLNFTKSKGFNNTGDDYNKVYNWGSESTNDVYEGFANNKGRHSPLIAIQPSWDFYGKMKTDDLTIKSRASYSRQRYMWGANLDCVINDAIFKHMFVEIEKEYELSKHSSLSNKINFHTLSYERGVLVQPIDPLVQADLETKTEMGVNLESIFKITLAEKHNIIAGLKAAFTEFGPNQRQQYVVGTGSTTLNGNYPIGYKYSYVTDANREDTYGAYIEDSFDVTNKFTLVGGISYEYSDCIEVGGKVMPRAAAIYQLTNKLSGKYCYNTGYERPPVDKKFHKMFGHVEKSEDIAEHDLQLSYNTERTQASATAFYYVINNYFTWISVIENNSLTAMGHANSGDGRSDGFELSLRQKITKSLDLIGNFTYASTKINNSSPIGDPMQMYNVGAEYLPLRDLSVNLNINGFADMPNGYPNGATWRGDGEQLVDLTIVKDNLFGRPLSLTLFSHNMFNTKVHATMTGWPGYTYEEGSSFGIKVSYQL